MKITATDLDGVLSPIVLGDDANGDIIVDPQPLPAETRTVQVTPLFRADQPFIRGRGNRVVSFAWVVSRAHANVATAVAFVWGHAALVPNNVSLVIADGSGAGTYTGVITGVVCLENYGLATVFRYSATGVVN